MLFVSAHEGAQHEREGHRGRNIRRWNMVLELVSLTPDHHI